MQSLWGAADATTLATAAATITTGTANAPAITTFATLSSAFAITAATTTNRVWDVP